MNVSIIVAKLKAKTLPKPHVGSGLGPSQCANFNGNKIQHNVIVNVMLTHNNCICALLMASDAPWVLAMSALAGTSAMALSTLISCKLKQAKLPGVV